MSSDPTLSTKKKKATEKLAREKQTQDRKEDKFNVVKCQNDNIAVTTKSSMTESGTEPRKQSAEPKYKTVTTSSQLVPTPNRSPTKAKPWTETITDCQYQDQRPKSCYRDRCPSTTASADDRFPPSLKVDATSTATKAGTLPPNSAARAVTDRNQPQKLQENEATES